MSEKSNKNSLSLKNVFKESFIALLIFSLVTVVTALILSFFLKSVSSPETFYPYVGYIILAISSYITGRAYLSKHKSEKIKIILTSTLFFITLVYLTALSMNNGKILILPILIKAVIILFLLFIASSSRVERKKRKKSSKRR